MSVHCKVFAPLSAAASRQSRRIHSSCEMRQPCCSTADYVPMSATASVGSNTGKEAFISKPGKPQTCGEPFRSRIEGGDTRNAASGVGRRLDLPCLNTKRAHRTVFAQKTARDGRPHGPVLSGVLRGSQFIRDNTALRSPQSGDRARSDEPGTNGTGWAQNRAQ